MLHRHVWANDTFSNWHDEKRVHTKEEYAADTVFETKEGKGKVTAEEKAKKLAFDNEVYGVKSEEALKVEADAALYAEGEALKSDTEEEAVKEVEKILAKGKSSK